MSQEESEPSGFKSTPIGEVKLTDASTVRVSTFDGRDGKKRVDIRLFLSGAKYTGPTKKGVSLPIDQLGELKALLDKVTQSRPGEPGTSSSANV